jgi:hypothetical protein
MYTDASSAEISAGLKSLKVKKLMTARCSIERLNGNADYI